MRLNGLINAPVCSFLTYIQALYESILVEPQFALFFLQRLAGKLNETDDLHSLDPELYRHLMALKQLTREGGAGSSDVADLSLNFEVVTGGGEGGEEAQGGLQQVTELVPGGKHVAVTSENVFRYIQLVANHRLNVEINAQVGREGAISSSPGASLSPLLCTHGR